jgi:DNA-binding beta-propeller fold protein YncE
MTYSGQGQPSPGEEVVIASTTYRFSAHPGAPGVPFGQEGRSAVVYQVAHTSGDLRAFKVFRSQFRTPRVAEGASQLRPFAALHGLAVCDRTVLTPYEHTTVLGAHPEYTYAVLMPWVAGRTWADVVLSRQALGSSDSRELAKSLVLILEAMEARGIAHCDLSAPNLVLDVQRHSVSLVDVEDLYAPGLQPPEHLPAGSDGYAHRTVSDGVWAPEGDRFAGAVLIAELLGWSDERVRAAAIGERFFARTELQSETERYQLLLHVLAERWGAAIAALFERAWLSANLGDCPPFSEWQAVVGGSSNEDLARCAAEREQLGDLEGALSIYRQAEAAASPGALKAELGVVVRELADKLDRFAPWTCTRCGRRVDAGLFVCPNCGQPVDAPAPPIALPNSAARRVPRAVIAGAIVVLLTLSASPRVSTPPPVTPAEQARTPLLPTPTWQIIGDTTSGLFSEPVGLSFDAQGDAYVSNNGTHSILKLDPAGHVVARWGTGGSPADQLHNPGALAVDQQGTLYVADTGNDRVLHFSADGALLGQIGGAGQWDTPRSVAVDGAGNVYVADSGNHRIEKFSSSGQLLAMWGSFGDGPANFNYPFGIALDGGNNLYVADRNNNRVVKLSPEGTALAHWQTDARDGGMLTNPSSVAVDVATGTVYVGGWGSDRVERVTKLSADGKLLASWDLGDDGPAELSLPFQIALDARGNLHVPELSADRLESFQSDGRLLGTLGAVRAADGELRRPNNVAIDARDNVYVTDWGNERVVKFSPTAITGSNVQVLAHWGPFRDPQGVAVDPEGNIYVTERTDCHVRKLSTAGLTLAEWGSCGGGADQFQDPEAIAADTESNLYVADRGNDRIVKLATSGNVVRIFGKHGSGNGEFNQPTGVTVDASGNIFVADRDNHRIVKLSANGQMLGAWGSENGSGDLQLSAPEGIAVDRHGDMYVADWGASRVVELAPSGAMLAELGAAGSRPGQFDAEEGLAVDSHGRVYVADTGNNRVQERF